MQAVVQVDEVHAPPGGDARMQLLEALDLLARDCAEGADPAPGRAAVLGLAGAIFAGDRVPLLIACFPLVLMASVLVDWAARRIAARSVSR